MQSTANPVSIAWYSDQRSLPVAQSPYIDEHHLPSPVIHTKQPSHTYTTPCGRVGRMQISEAQNQLSPPPLKVTSRTSQIGSRDHLFSPIDIPGGRCLSSVILPTNWADEDDSDDIESGHDCDDLIMRDLPRVYLMPRSEAKAMEDQ